MGLSDRKDFTTWNRWHDNNLTLSSDRPGQTIDIYDIKASVINLIYDCSFGYLSANSLLRRLATAFVMAETPLSNEVHRFALRNYRTYPV